jgi:TonB family protein
MNSTWPRFREATKVAQAEESQLILSRLDKGELQALPSALPTRKCIPAKESSHGDIPKVRAKDFPSSESYIAKAARAGAFGAVADLIVVVDSRGCPERALLIGPSGHAALDSGALRFVVDGYYFPAEKDGVATRGAQWIRFTLDSTP